MMTRSEPGGRPSAQEARAAVRTLIQWAGDDPDREGLQDTPARVARPTRNSSTDTRAIPESTCGARLANSAATTRW